MGTKKYNLDYLNEISGGDKDFILDMIQTFFNNTPNEIAELKGLTQNGEWLKVGENAHKFAPSLQFLGLNSLRPIINQIEDYAFAKEHTEMILPLVLKLEAQCMLVLDELKSDFNI